MSLKIVLDSNVIVAALRSSLGASHRLLRRIDRGEFTPCLSVPLVLEYEDAAKRLIGATALSAEDIDAVLDYLCRVSIHQQVFYLWRPLLRDPKDDMVLELAVNAGCSYLVTFNQRDFHEAGQFGIRVATPRQFLHDLGASS